MECHPGGDWDIPDPGWNPRSKMMTQKLLACIFEGVVGG